MNKFSLSLLLIFATSPCYPLFAQDLLVTASGDSLNCRILKQKGGFVHFRYMKNKQPTTTLIADNEVKSIRKAWYGVPALPPDPPATYAKWHYDLYGGYAYRIGKVPKNLPPQARDYLKKLKSGYMLGAGIHRFITENTGLGLRYDFNQYKNESSSGSDNIMMHYIGFSYLNRGYTQGDKGILTFGANMGYQSYKDKGEDAESRVTITGGTFGVGLEFAYAVKIAPAAALRFGFHLQAASLSKLKVSDGITTETIELDKDNIENISRIGLTAGLTFGK